MISVFSPSKWSYVPMSFKGTQKDIKKGCIFWAGVSHFTHPLISPCRLPFLQPFYCCNFFFLCYTIPNTFWVPNRALETVSFLGNKFYYRFLEGTYSTLFRCPKRFLGRSPHFSQKIFSVSFNYHVWAGIGSTLFGPQNGYWKDFPINHKNNLRSVSTTAFGQVLVLSVFGT